MRAKATAASPTGTAHRNYFGRQGKFSEDMMLMCERFRLVEVLEDSTVAS